MVAVLHSAAVAMGVVQVPLVFLYLSAEEGEGREKEEKKVSFCQFCCLKRYNDNTNAPLRSGGWCRQSEQQQDEGGSEKSGHSNSFLFDSRLENSGCCLPCRYFRMTFGRDFLACEFCWTRAVTYFRACTVTC